MKIKKILNLKQKIATDEFKKRIAQVGAVSLGVLLTIVAPKVQKVYQEAQYKIEQQKLEEENAEKKISLLSCKVLVENCPDGTVKHHFIDKDYEERNLEEHDGYDEKTYKYRAITDKNFLFTNSKIVYDTASYFEYKATPETRGRYIFDYNVPYYIFDTTDLFLPEGYSLNEFYSVNDLKELEEKLNESIYEREENKSHAIGYLFLVEVNGEFMCFDFGTVPTEVTETTDKTDVTKLRTVYYFPSVGNHLMNLKVSSGMNAIEDKVFNYYILSIPINCAFEDITCLDQTIRNDFSGCRPIQHNLYDYLTEEQISNGKITDVEICSLLEQLNNQYYRFTR